MRKLAYASMALVLMPGLAACAAKDVESAKVERGIRVDDPDISSMHVDAIAGSYAKATVTSSHGMTETEYLEKEKGYWLVEARGTRVDPYTLGIPKKYVDALVR